MVLQDGGAQLLPPDTQTGWGEHDAQRTGTWAEGPHPGKDEPPLETKGMHAGLGRGEAPPRPFTSCLLPNQTQLAAKGNRGRLANQVRWAQPGVVAMRGRRRNLRAGTPGALCSGSSQGQCRVRQKPAWGADKGGRNGGDLVQASRHQVSGSRMRGTTVSCNPRGERSRAGRHHLNLGGRPCGGKVGSGSI